MREVVMNDKSNLLQLEEHFYQLVDVDEPNTFRNLFPYEEIPKIAFNDRIVPHNMPDEIWITDTTFRDGQQSRAPYTTEQMITYINLAVRRERFVRVNSSYIVRKTATRYINVWNVAISFRKSLPGFVPANRTFSWSKTWVFARRAFLSAVLTTIFSIK